MENNTYEIGPETFCKMISDRETFHLSRNFSVTQSLIIVKTEERCKSKNVGAG